jgi:hypothetical protein
MKRSGVLSLLGLATALVGLGCGNSGGTGSRAENSEGSLASRFKAAKAITVQHERDTALAKLAEDAAVAGEPELVKKSVLEITAMPDRDAAAAASAVKLARAKREDAAVEVARLITDQAQRDTVLGAIARGVGTLKAGP